MLTDFVNRFETNPAIWPVIQLLQTKYPLGLLTNAYPGMFDNVKTAGLLPPI